MLDSKLQTLANLISHSEHGVLFVDINSWEIVYSNSSFHSQMSYSAEEVLDKKIDLFFSDYPLLQTSLDKLAKTESKYKWMMKGKSNTLIPATLQFTNLNKITEGNESIVCISIEWSNQPSFEKTIRSSEEKLRTFFASMNNGIVIVNENGIILDIAPTFKFLLFQVLGLESGELIFSFLDTTLQRNLLLKIRETIQEKITNTLEFEYDILKQEHIFEIRIIPIRRPDPKDKKAMLVFSDISESKKIDRQLIESMKFASLGEIAAGLAHEINNPLQSSLLYLEDLISVGEDDPIIRTSILKKIESANQRIRDLVRALLDLGRMESPNRDFVSPYYILVRASELVEVSCKKKQIEFTRHAGPNLPGLFVRWQEIEQVLINCVMNAINALSEMETPRENPKIKLGIDLIKEQKKDWVVFSIEDNGPGIDDNTLEKVFLPLFTTRRNKQGTGLGLSISKKIVQDHGGDIFIKTKFNLGTKIEIHLPAHIEENG